MATYAGGMAADDADVVYHGTVMHKGFVKAKFGMAAHYVEGFLAYLPAVVKQEAAQRGVFGIETFEEGHLVV